MGSRSSHTPSLHTSPTVSGRPPPPRPPPPPGQHILTGQPLGAPPCRTASHWLPPRRGRCNCHRSCSSAHPTRPHRSGGARAPSSAWRRRRRTSRARSSPRHGSCPQKRPRSTAGCKTCLVLTKLIVKYCQNPAHPCVLALMKLFRPLPSPVADPFIRATPK